MADDLKTDYYEILQISVNAEPDTIHRVYRLLAQRFHPDNLETGNAERFRQIHDAYGVLSDPERRAQYDIVHERVQKDRWRLVSTGEQSETDFEFEDVVRLTVLEALYTRRRLEPGEPGLYDIELEQLIGRPRESLEFTTWYLGQRQLVTRTDSSRLTITAAGVDYLEQHYKANLHRRRLSAASEKV